MASLTPIARNLANARHQMFLTREQGGSRIETITGLTKELVLRIFVRWICEDKIGNEKYLKPIFEHTSGEITTLWKR